MATNGMTIDSLNTVSSLTAQDKVPVWDNESSGEPTRKITAQNLTNSVKTLGSLVNTTEMNTAIAQSTADLNNKIIRLQDKFGAINVDGTSDGDGDITIDLDNTTYALIGCTPDRTGITGGYTGVFFVLPYGATTGGKYLAKILKDDMTILRNQKVLFKVNYIRRAD